MIDLISRLPVCARNGESAVASEETAFPTLVIANPMAFVRFHKTDTAKWVVPAT
jgi:hypothetical protein